MHGHFLVRCPSCSRVTAQCRCADPNKQERLEVCYECKATTTMWVGRKETGMLRIGVDLDGVLVNFMRDFTEEMAPGYPFQHEEVVEWDWAKNKFGADVCNKFWRTTANDPNFWLKLQAYSGHDCNLTNLLTQRHQVYFITHRPAGTEKATAEWLKIHVGKYHEGQVIYADHKGHVAKGLQLHAMIDDKPSNLVDVNTVSPDTRCVMLDQPWNRSEENGAYSTRVYTLKDAFDFVEFGICRSPRSSSVLKSSIG